MMKELLRLVLIIVIVTVFPATVLAHIDFTGEEKDYIDKLKVIKVAVSLDNISFENRIERQEYERITVDFTKLILQKLSLVTDVIPIKNLEEGMLLFDKGEVDIMTFSSKTPVKIEGLIFTNPIIINSSINKRRLAWNIIGNKVDSTKKFSFGIKAEDVMLKNLINKAIAAMTISEKEEILKRHREVLEAENNRHKTSIIIVLVILLIIFFLIYKNYNQKKENKKIAKWVDALKASQEKYDQLSRQSRTFTWETNEKGIFTYINPLAEEILGVKPEELVGKSYFYDPFPPEQKEAIKKLGFNALDKGEDLHNLESNIVTRYGKEVWLLTNGICSFDAKGKVKGFNASVVDITERKLVENQLKESEKNYRLLFENAVEAILVIEGFTIKVVNPMIESISGYREDEIINTSFLNYIYSDDLDSVREFHKRRLEGTEENSQLHFRLIKKDGTIRWVESKGLKMEWNGKAASINFVVDITEKKEAEDELRKSEEKYRLLTEFASDVIWVFNIDKNKLTYVSPSIEQLTGYTVEETLLAKSDETMTPDSLKKVSEAIKTNMNEFLKNPNSVEYYINEAEYLCKDGSTIWVETSTKYRFNKENEIEIVGVNRNVDKRKKAEDDIIYLSYHDQLTGLYNRRFLEVELKRLDTERNYPLTIVMLDLNGLKLANDAFGHHMGDKLLEKASEVLKTQFRSDEIIARIGGDEFLIILPNTGNDKAKTILNRLDKAIKNEKIGYLNLSLSYGYATKNFVQEDMDDIYKRAEDLMYEKKVSEKIMVRERAINNIKENLYEKSHYELEHSYEISKLVVEIGKVLKISDRNLEILEKSAMYHDIGKIALSEEILNKPDKLTDIEWVEVKKHPQVAYNILSTLPDYVPFINIILNHHEHWDGNGYPKGLKGEEIPLLSRILLVADAYIAMISDRPFRAAYTHEKAVSIIKENRGVQFDPLVVDAFLFLEEKNLS